MSKAEKYGDLFAAIRLPIGFSKQPCYPGQYRWTAISHDHGTMTIDLEQRKVRAGWCTTGRDCARGDFTGRGWLERLVDAAVQQLEAITPTAAAGRRRSPGP